MEIERKFLVRQDFMQNIDKMHLTKKNITQYYVKLGDEEERYRRVIEENGTERFFHTQKRVIDNTFVREEIEEEVSKDEYYGNKPSQMGYTLHKTRYILDVGRYTMEIDQYLGTLAPLCIAEVEFDSKLSAKKFNPPVFCHTEVTGDAQFSSQSIMRLLTRLESEKNTSTIQDVIEI